MNTVLGCIAWILFMTSTSVLADPMFLAEQHHGSGRNVILEEEDGATWLYLTYPNEKRIEKGAFAYSLTSPDENFNRERVKSGKPPQISKEYASQYAVIQNVQASKFSFNWSADGESVALRYNDQIIAMILSTESRGYSKALSKPGPLGNPFDSEKAKIFVSKGPA